MSDKKYILTDCPKCGTEHRVHKLRAARGTVRCTNCKTLFFVTNLTKQERAFMAAFGKGGK